MAPIPTNDLTSAEMLELKYLRQREYLRMQGLQDIPYDLNHTRTSGQPYLLNQLPDHVQARQSLFTNMHHGQQATQDPTYAHQLSIQTQSHQHNSGVHHPTYPNAPTFDFEPQSGGTSFRVPQYPRLGCVPLEQSVASEEQLHITSRTHIPVSHSHRTGTKFPRLSDEHICAPSYTPLQYNTTVSSPQYLKQPSRSASIPPTPSSSLASCLPTSTQCHPPGHSLYYRGSSDLHPGLNPNEQKKIRPENTARDLKSFIPLQCHNCLTQDGAGILWSQSSIHPGKIVLSAYFKLCNGCDLFERSHQNDEPHALRSNPNNALSQKFVGSDLLGSSVIGSSPLPFSLYRSSGMLVTTPAESPLQAITSSSDITSSPYPPHDKNKTYALSSRLKYHNKFPFGPKPTVPLAPFALRDPNSTDIPHNPEIPSLRSQYADRETPALGRTKIVSKLEPIEPPLLLPISTPEPSTLLTPFTPVRKTRDIAHPTTSSSSIPSSPCPPYRREGRHQTFQKHAQTSRQTLDLRLTNNGLNISINAGFKARPHADVKVKAEPLSPSTSLKPVKKTTKTGHPGTKLTAHHKQELHRIWAADPRVPTLASRKAWAEARGVAKTEVVNWFTRKRANFMKSRLEVGEGSYDLPVCAPEPEERAIKHESEVVTVSAAPVKSEENGCKTSISADAFIDPPALRTRSKLELVSAAGLHESDTHSKLFDTSKSIPTPFDLSKTTVPSSRKRKSEATKRSYDGIPCSLPKPSKLRKILPSNLISAPKEPQTDAKEPISGSTSDTQPPSCPAEHNIKVKLVKDFHVLVTKPSEKCSALSADGDVMKSTTYGAKSSKAGLKRNPTATAFEPVKTTRKIPRNRVVTGAESSASALVQESSQMQDPNATLLLHKDVISCPISRPTHSSAANPEYGRYRTADIRFVLPSRHWEQLSSIPLLMRRETAALVECLSGPAMSDEMWRANLSEQARQDERLMPADETRAMELELGDGFENMEFSTEHLQEIVQLNREMEDEL